MMKNIFWLRPEAKIGDKAFSKKERELVRTEIELLLYETVRKEMGERKEEDKEMH